MTSAPSCHWTNHRSIMYVAISEMQQYCCKKGAKQLYGPFQLWPKKSMATVIVALQLQNSPLYGLCCLLPRSPNATRLLPVPMSLTMHLCSEANLFRTLHRTGRPFVSGSRCVCPSTLPLFTSYQATAGRVAQTQLATHGRCTRPVPGCSTKFGRHK